MINTVYIGDKMVYCMDNHHETAKQKADDSRICLWALDLIEKEVND